MHVRILYHDNCFDGAASSALFSAFYQTCIDGQATFEYIGLSHGPGDVFTEGTFHPHPQISVEHACLDFRYSPDPRLTWWFDHHQSAFLNKEDEIYFYQLGNSRHFYDPTARSCSKFLALVCQKVFHFDPQPYEELIYWADRIDGAQFDTPQSAVELKEPALQLMTWVEANRDIALKERFIYDLGHLSIEQINRQSYIRSSLDPLLDQQMRNVEIIRQFAQCENGVVTYDVSEQFLGSTNKFIPYYLYPDCHYVVGIVMMPGHRLKVSVGTNPWYAARRTANIAAICSRYGGGGHPVVGAISFLPEQMVLARQIAADIAQELREAVRLEQ